jgi:intracellular sulfur oxidation DsrE/DsrF family protein
MKIIATVVLFCLSLTLSAQYYSYETSIVCPANKKEMAMEGFENMKRIFNSMVSDEKLLNFEAWSDIGKDTIQLMYFVSAENDSSFKKIMREWRKRSSQTYPEFFTPFWKECKKVKEEQSGKLALLFPVIKGDRGAQVVVVDKVDDKPDTKMNYNLVVDLSAYSELDDKKHKLDSSITNWGVSNIGRIMNLHVASGIPKNKLNFVVAVHGMAMISFLSNEEYQKRFKRDNPNLNLIDELSKAGVKFLACGQSVSWMGLDRSKLSDQVKIALSAQTVLTSYQLKGYILKSMEN